MKPNLHHLALVSVNGVTDEAGLAVIWPIPSSLTLFHDQFRYGPCTCPSICIFGLPLNHTDLKENLNVLSFASLIALDVHCCTQNDPNLRQITELKPFLQLEQLKFTLK